MLLVPCPRKLARHGASLICQTRCRGKRVVAAGAVAVVMVGGGANEIGEPAIAAAMTNTTLSRRHDAVGEAALPRCTVWALIDESTESCAAIANIVFYPMGARTSAIDIRRCGPNYQYPYVDIRNGYASCISTPVRGEVHADGMTHCLHVAWHRCR